MLTRDSRRLSRWIAGIVLAVGMPALVLAQDGELEPRSNPGNPTFLGRFFNPPPPKRVEPQPPRETAGNGGLFLPLKSFSNAFRGRPRDTSPSDDSRVPSRPPREPFESPEPDFPKNRVTPPSLDDEIEEESESTSEPADTEDSDTDMEIPPSFSKLNTQTSQATRLSLSGSKLGTSTSDAPSPSSATTAPTAPPAKTYEANPKIESLDSKGTSRRSRSQPVEPRMPKPTKPVSVPASETATAIPSAASQSSTPTAGPAKSESVAATTSTVEKREPVGPRKVPSTVVSRSSLASPIEQSKTPATSVVTLNPSKGIDLQSPGLKLRMVGPESILIGQAIPYEVTATNDGTNVLQGLTVRLRLPSHVVVSEPVSSDGEVQAISDGQGSGVDWTLPKLAAGTSKSLRLMIRTQQPEHFALSLDWTIDHPSVQMPIRVQQPQLLLALEGPSEADYGQPQTYRLRVRNPGNAEARDVRVQLQTESQPPQESIVGDLPAGSERVIEMNMTFEQAGQLTVNARAISEVSKLESTSRVDVDVRQCQLIATWNGPTEFYQGNTAEYVLTLENQGTTAALKNTCLLEIPSGVEVSALPTGFTRNGNQLRWEIPQLAIGEILEWNFQCVMNQLGDNTFALKIESTTGTTVESSIRTQVDAVADLQLLVNDPVAPAPIGKPVVYEITVSNRGKKAAEDVYVIAQFSDGIEPSHVDGHTGQLVPGQVLFDNIPKIAPGEQIVLKITAQASKPGTHRFRAVVRCQGTEDDMLKEESTRYTATNTTRSDRK